MPWVVHSTVPYPMLKEPDTPRMLRTPASGRRSISPEGPGRDHPVRGGNCRAEAP